MDREKVIKGFTVCSKHGLLNGEDCHGHYEYTDNLANIIKANDYSKQCPYNGCKTGCVKTLAKDVLALLKEQEARELTMDEWREWKNNPKRNPICMLWEHDISPMWILNPNDVHEPALLIGKLKLFTGKPTFEQCKAVKWK